MRLIILCSTNGSVLSKVLHNDYFKAQIDCVITDRECGVMNVAEAHQVNIKKYEAATGEEFSKKIVENIELTDDHLIISFYTRILSNDLIEKIPGRIINCHPSILPACPGLNGFEDTISSGSQFIGATIHLIDQGIDTGLPIMQSARPFNPNLSLSENRHAIFIDQCRMLLQVVKWFDENRVRHFDGRLVIENAQYKPNCYAPNLDFDLAINFDVELEK